MSAAPCPGTSSQPKGSRASGCGITRYGEPSLPDICGLAAILFTGPGPEEERMWALSRSWDKSLLFFDGRDLAAGW
jgi:hypothetical protein